MHTDILIVGGGLSGLALADHLAATGRDFVLIEAQDRLGGRIWSPNLSGARFDLGPAWFWPGQPRMAALAQRFQIPVFEQFADGDLMFETQTGDVQRGRGYASMAGSYRLDGGMGALVDRLAGHLDGERLWLNTRLEKLQHSSAGVTAQIVRDGVEQRLEARHVVLAIPPRVVADTVTFEPALEDAQTRSLAAVPTWMAGQAKIVATYDQPHWRHAGLSGDAMSQRGPMVEIHDASPSEGGPYALFGFVGIAAATRAAHRDEMMQLAKAQLVSLFGPQMAEPRNLILQDWATIPEIARPLDHAPLGHHPSYGLPASITQLAERGIHFGSTETAPGFGGYLEGALEAAENVARALAPQSVQSA
ncbi:MAG: FAD-dependent oxidoreductase [Rhizobiaceae bacterium]|nr:FAD-dependent oxidoreductase [Rhizobiaceae bacterium]